MPSVAPWLCEAAGEVSACLTYSHWTCQGNGCFLDFFLNAAESESKSARLINSYSSAFQEGQGSWFLPGEHYANSVVKHIGIVLPFACAVFADSIGAFAVCSECRGLVLDGEQLSCVLCCHHRQETCLQFCLWIEFFMWSTCLNNATVMLVLMHEDEI